MFILDSYFNKIIINWIITSLSFKFWYIRVCLWENPVWSFPPILFEQKLLFLMSIAKSYSKGQLLNYLWRFSVLFTKHFYDFLLDSDQIIPPRHTHPFNRIKSFLPRESEILPVQPHVSVPHTQSYLCVSLSSSPPSEHSTCFQTIVSLQIFPLPDMPFSGLLSSPWIMDPLRLMNNDSPASPPSTVRHAFLPPLTTLVRLSLSTDLPVLFMYSSTSSRSHTFSRMWLFLIHLWVLSSERGIWPQQMFNKWLVN